jgi:succinate dehydrogenase / fumarate reductase, iron-sulfur subunit
MVQLTLPKNSQIRDGKVWPKPEGATNLREYKVYRWSPDDDENPRVDTYFVDADDCGPMILDALIWIKNKIDPTLTFRRSCREGICGSCSMNIDGTNTLACTKGADEVSARSRSTRCRTCRWSRIWCPISPCPMRSSPRSSPGCRRSRPSPPRNGSRAARTGRSSTGSTSASCASAARPPARPTGGTASAIWARPCCLQAYRWLIDSPRREHRRGLDNLEDPFRLYRCHTIMNCTQACPKGLNPAKAIAEIKKMMVERRV